MRNLVLLVAGCLLLGRTHAQMLRSGGVDEWNQTHPLMAISESERPKYWQRPPAGRIYSFSKSIAEYEERVGKADWRILLDHPLSPESAMAYLLSHPDRSSLKLRAALYVYIGSPGDLKRSVGSMMKLPSGELDKFAGKNAGNWQAGYISYAVGASEFSSRLAAGAVQFIQDTRYIMDSLSGGPSYTLDHFPGFDERQGEKVFLAGRDFAFRKEYKKFVKGELFPSSPSLMGNKIPSNVQGSNATATRERDSVSLPSYVPREKSSRDDTRFFDPRRS